MLAITGAMNVWFIINVNDMRMGRCRLIDIVKDRFPNPYDGDMFAFYVGMLSDAVDIELATCLHANITR